MITQINFLLRSTKETEEWKKPRENNKKKFLTKRKKKDIVNIYVRTERKKTNEHIEIIPLPFSLMV